MKNSAAIAHVRAKAKKAIGPSFDEKVFLKALAKLKRWMKNAYGDSDDWENCLGESADDGIVMYYRETLEHPDGIQTENRVSEITTRKDRRASK